MDYFNRLMTVDTYNKEIKLFTLGNFLIDRFRRLANKLYEEDKEFRELCVDYASCIQALSKYKRLSKEGEKSVEDYEKAIDELEKEIYDFIFP